MLVKMTTGLRDGECGDGARPEVQRHNSAQSFPQGC